MSERKVLNKYYPPDFDPTKIPKLKAGRNKQFSIRIMSPFNMRCNTCGGYIYKGKKFNSRKETVEDETYLGLYIFRFYIKCPMCVAEIAFKTDPENTDYTLEAGATRNFEALRTAELLAEKELAEKEEDEASNPMKVLENRTKSSRQEMDMLETLEDLKEMNSRHAKMDHAQVIKLHQAYEEQLKRLQDEEDEELVKSLFGTDGDGYVKRLPDPEEMEAVPKKMARMDNSTDFLTKTQETPAQKDTDKKPGGYIHVSTAGKSSRAALSMLVKRKQPTKPPVKDTEGKTAVKASEGKTAATDSGGKTTDKTTQEDIETKTAKATTSVDKTEQKTVQKISDSKSNEPKPSGSMGLSMLGDYSDSSGGDSN